MRASPQCPRLSDRSGYFVKHVCRAKRHREAIHQKGPVHLFRKGLSAPGDRNPPDLWPPGAHLPYLWGRGTGGLRSLRLLAWDPLDRHRSRAGRDTRLFPPKVRERSQLPAQSRPGVPAYGRRRFSLDCVDFALHRRLCVSVGRPPVDCSNRLLVLCCHIFLCQAPRCLVPWHARRPGSQLLQRGSDYSPHPLLPPDLHVSKIGLVRRLLLSWMRRVSDTAAANPQCTQTVPRTLTAERLPNTGSTRSPIEPSLPTPLRCSESALPKACTLFSIRRSLAQCCHWSSSAFTGFG